MLSTVFIKTDTWSYQEPIGKPVKLMPYFFRIGNFCFLINRSRMATDHHSINRLGRIRIGDIEDNYFFAGISHQIPYCRSTSLKRRRRSKFITVFPAVTEAKNTNPSRIFPRCHTCPCRRCEGRNRTVQGTPGSFVNESIQGWKMMAPPFNQCWRSSVKAEDKNACQNNNPLSCGCLRRNCPTSSGAVSGLSTKVNIFSRMWLWLQSTSYLTGRESVT